MWRMKTITRSASRATTPRQRSSVPRQSGTPESNIANTSVTYSEYP